MGFARSKPERAKARTVIQCEFFFISIKNKEA